jgi:uncharacterized membrane protein
MNARWKIAMACAGWLACGGDNDGEDEEGASVGEATGAVCDATLRYETDIAPIASMYCTRCHATALTGRARNGAPDDHNFDSEQGILAEKTHVDEVAGSGPNATGTWMPPAGSPQPTIDQRVTLAKWLACQR